MTRGHRGLLALRCTTLSFATPRRFIPAHRSFPRTPIQTPPPRNEEITNDEPSITNYDHEIHSNELVTFFHEATRSGEVIVAERLLRVPHSPASLPTRKWSNRKGRRGLGTCFLDPTVGPLARVFLVAPRRRDGLNAMGIPQPAGTAQVSLVFSHPDLPIRLSLCWTSKQLTFELNGGVG